MTSRVDDRDLGATIVFVHASPFLLCSLCIPNNVDMLTHCLLQWDAFETVFHSLTFHALQLLKREQIFLAVSRQAISLIDRDPFFVRPFFVDSHIYSTIDTFIRIYRIISRDRTLVYIRIQREERAADSLNFIHTTRTRSCILSFTSCLALK